MAENKFINEYDIILCGLSSLPDRFNQEYHLFVGQCIRWLASIIQFKEILIHYHHYKIFLLEYVKNWAVMPLPNEEEAGIGFPESNIPILNIKEPSIHSNRSSGTDLDSEEY